MRFAGVWCSTIVMLPTMSSPFAAPSTIAAGSSHAGCGNRAAAVAMTMPTASTAMPSGGVRPGSWRAYWRTVGWTSTLVPSVRPAVSPAAATLGSPGTGPTSAGVTAKATVTAPKTHGADGTMSFQNQPCMRCATAAPTDGVGWSEVSSSGAFQTTAAATTCAARCTA